MTRPPAASGAAARVCVVSVDNIYVKRSGNSNYLDNIARMIAASGCETHFMALTPMRADQARLRIDRDYLGAYRSFNVRGAVPFRGQLLNTSPAAWAQGLTKRLRRPRPRGVAEIRNWTLPAPPEAALDWAARRVAALAPDLLIANYFNAAALFDRVSGPRTAIIAHDVLALRAESAREAGVPLDFDPEALVREARAFDSADACFAITDAEAAFLRARHPRLLVKTVPYALEIPDGDLSAPRDPVCVFVGSMNRPNHGALLWLLTEIWPQVRARRPQARLRVIGAIANAVDVAWPEGAEKVGYAEDLAAEYARARVALAPLRFGSGMKIKVVEGLAHGLPTVSTTVGVEGIAEGPADALRVADDAAGFAAAMIDLLDPEDRPELRRRARAFAAAHYARAVAGAGLLDGVLSHA